MISGYTIRSLNVSPGLVLAPMSGVTTSAFRRLIKELNPGCVSLTITEFISVEAMTRGVRRSLEMMKFREEERPIGIQIFGYDPQRMRDAAQMAQDSGADLVDINCGCPAPKVVRKGGGCELMRQPDHLKSLLKGVRSAVTVPLTMKMRSGWDEHSKNAEEIAFIAEGEGIEALAIHGRTRAQLYRGEADWSFAESISEKLSIPVLGSGDVVSRDSAKNRLKGKIAGLMIGRGAMSNPYVFSEIMGAREEGSLKSSRELSLNVTRRYVELLREDFSDSACIGKLKQLVSQMAKGSPWRKAILQAMSMKEIDKILIRSEDSKLFPAARNEEISCSV